GHVGRRAALQWAYRCASWRLIVNRARKVLVFGGLALAAFGMLYGLYYAVFVEHQTLDQMGGSLANAFVHAAQRQMADSRAALDAYASVKYDYVRQVDVHSHWIGLGARCTGSYGFWCYAGEDCFLVPPTPGAGCPRCSQQNAGSTFKLNRSI